VKLQLAENNGRRKTPWIFWAIGSGAIVGCLVITVAVAWNFYSIRTATKWFLWSQRYKSEVLAQSGGAAGELKHIEWDGWGWVGDTTVYLVFDSTDSLSVAAADHAPGKFNGIPCEVAQVSQLESHWYTVQFYTDEFWGRRNALDCTGLGR
jgi:hypothetical protein